MAGDAKFDLSVVVLIWNSRRFIPDCFRSFARAVQGFPIEFVVVDNGSTDDGLQLLWETIPQAQVIRNTFNRGVAAARNQGLAAARGRYLCLLDVDTCFLEGDVRALVQFMDQNPQVGLAGCRLVHADGSAQLSYRKFPTVQSKICRCLPGHYLDHWRAEEYYSPVASASIQEVDYVIGAFQLIRRETFESIGYLDDSIFYGPEDADYCLRVWSGGWKVVYYPYISILHHEQRITRRRLGSPITWKHLAGLAHYFRKHGYWFSREKLYCRKIPFRQSAPKKNARWKPEAAPQL